VRRVASRTAASGRLVPCMLGHYRMRYSAFGIALFVGTESSRRHVVILRTRVLEVLSTIVLAFHTVLYFGMTMVPEIGLPVGRSSLLKRNAAFTNRGPCASQTANELPSYAVAPENSPFLLTA
jgi:hypothetical protein